MLTTDILDLTPVVEAAREAAEFALEDQSAEQFELVERRVNELDAALREIQQALWAGDAKKAVRHLENHQPLTEQDLQVIRLFLVADAEHYLAQENNFQDWTRELKRLFAEIGRRVNGVNRDTIGTLRGLIRDAVRLVPDVRNYLDERRRLQLFEQGLEELDDAARATLARLMRDQLANPKI